MLEFLFVDDQLSDNSSSASIAARKLEESGEYRIIKVDFTEAEQKICDSAPDLVILDLKEEMLAGETQLTGNTICEWIWENRFCPIVVYSAFPDELPVKYASHPFVEVVKKGRKAVEKLKESITNLRPQIESIRDAEDSIRKEFSFAMREVAPYAYATFTSNPARRDDSILRSGRRRLAALLDGLSKYETTLASFCPETGVAR